MTFIKNNLAAVKIGINTFFAVVSGYFLIASDIFKVNPWYLVLIYSVISLVVILLLWLMYRLIFRGTKAAVKNAPGLIKKVPGKISSKHQTKSAAKPVKRGKRK